MLQSVSKQRFDGLAGYRHRFENGKHIVAKIKEHRYGSAVEPSGFFELPEAENISAVLVNPQGTLPKFNRMGFIAGFGDRSINMFRRGLWRADREGVPLKPFVHEVFSSDYRETWIEGAVVLHNPNARITLNPELLYGAAHE